MGGLGIFRQAVRLPSRPLSEKTFYNEALHLAAAMAVLCALAVTTGPRTAGARALDDLNLANRLEQSGKVVRDIQDPHAFDCEECHEKAGDTKFIVYIVDSDTVSLCTECHTPEHLHPVGMIPTDDSFVLERLELPLGTGLYEGKVVCLTCHYVHDRDYKRNLLRGDKQKRTSSRKYLCSRCHTGDLITRSPHDPESKACNFCHDKVPQPGEGGHKLSDILKKNVQASCDFCHGALDNGHFLSVNPFADPDVTWRFDRLGIPLLNGRFSCISCHDPHAYENRKRKMLRDSYLRLAAKSQHVNPHWKQVLCIACHEKPPTEGDPNLRFGGDGNVLCGRCHNGRFARSDMHPVGVMPDESVSIPDGMPLYDGRISCSTCHDSSLQEGGETSRSEREDNPNFLRGGHEERNDYCLKCHLRGEYARHNPHDQTDVWGDVQEKACFFCHTAPPDVEVLGIENVKFSAENLDGYCTICHGEGMFFDNHPRGPHLVEPSAEVFEAIETAEERIGVELPLYNDCVTCATCHNPHGKGVIKTSAAAAGADNPKRLRLGNSLMLCTGCHADKL